jgi:hypothetical protein
MIACDHLGSPWITFDRLMVRRQDPALDALLVWLNDEPAHVERLMKTPQGIAQLCVVMEVKHMGTFSNMLNALSQIVYKSTVINRALGKVDPSLSASPFVTALIRRLSSNGLERRSHPLDALVRRLLLTILTEIYRKHQEPKQLVKLHHLSALLKGIIDQDKAVLVRQVASELFESFKLHDIL